MKALLSTAPGGPDTLELRELPEPVAGPGEVVVQVHACGVNFPDALIISDRYQLKPPRPFAPGGEVAGLVSQVGADVSDVSSGDRVLALCGFGGMAESVKVPAAACHRLPEAMSFEDVRCTRPPNPHARSATKLMGRAVRPVRICRTWDPGARLSG